MKYTDYYSDLNELNFAPQFDPQGFGEAFILSPGSKPKHVSPKNGKQFEQSEVERMLGKDLRVIPLNKDGRFDYYMVISMELPRMKLNPFATELMYADGGVNYHVYGNALVCNTDQLDFQ